MSPVSYLNLNLQIYKFSVSEQGLSFRPAFQDIRGIREAFAELKDVPMLALTATATYYTQVKVSINIIKIGISVLSQQC